MEEKAVIKEAESLLEEFENLSSLYRSSLEGQYVKDILETLIKYRVLKDRTGTGILTGGTSSLVYKGNAIPKLLGKRVYPKLALGEILWFLQGKTDKESLNKLGVHYWDKFFREDGTIGKSYGYQFRAYKDQVKTLIDNMLKDPCSRRHIINLWNVADLDEMVLPPCFYNYQFSCKDSREKTNFSNPYFEYDLIVTSRSADAFLGVPYNFLTSFFFQAILMNYLSSYHVGNGTDYICNTIVWNIANFHIYLNHIPQCLKYCRNYIEASKSILCIQNDIIVLPLPFEYGFESYLEKIAQSLVLETEDYYKEALSPKTRVTLKPVSTIINPDIITAELSV